MGVVGDNIGQKEGEHFMGVEATVRGYIHRLFHNADEAVAHGDHGTAERAQWLAPQTAIANLVEHGSVCPSENGHDIAHNQPTQPAHDPLAVAIDLAPPSIMVRILPPNTTLASVVSGGGSKTAAKA